MTALSLPITLASRTNRLFGQIIDGFIGAAPLVITVALSPLFHVFSGLLTLASFAWMAFYYLLGDGLPGGQSYAKKWLGMQVVDATTGAPCTFIQSFIRNLLLAVLGPLDWIFIFGERHQRLGDKAAGTIVIAD
jgi:uncharacterized RDD family membrane protein YckC